MFASIGWIVMMSLMGPGDDLPEVIVRADDTIVSHSCRIVIPSGAIIEDKNDNGVIQITASDVVVEFARGAVLRGAWEGVRPDEYRGYGICVNGQRGVTIRGAQVHGFRCGIHATAADKLVIENADASDCRRAFLRSTPSAEDEADWLTPHENDRNEWLTNYGAAIYVEDSAGVTVRGCRVRNGQNGLCLDRVRNSKVYDNDFSFLSGWGIAMWRSSGNVISRNAVDFCVRGYSHGVYNRGQDSAGFLVFEQCCDNFFAENSATHCGDGFFGFAGREALGEAPAPSKDFDYRRRGNNDNLLINNDFSYAPAHGIEMTFSFGNRLIRNRLVGNAICGVWGGFMQDAVIAESEIADNGEMGYGLERGGVNIEHGRNNSVTHNVFRDNRCGVHLWGGPTGISKLPWAAANGVESTNNAIDGNTFTGDRLAYHFRGPGDVAIWGDTLSNVMKETEADAEHKVIRDQPIAVRIETDKHPILGNARPVGSRDALRGRQNIIMTEWGPWDHQSPLIRLVETAGRSHTYEMRMMPQDPAISLAGSGNTGRLVKGDTAEDALRYEIATKEPGVHAYTMTVSAGKFRQTVKGTLVSATWQVRFFNWAKQTDPRQNVDAWRKLAGGPRAVTVETDRLIFRYGFGGPSNLGLSDELTKAGIGPDYFGMIARTALPLPKGNWKLATLSDDGVRVTVDGKTLIDEWSWHTPKRNEAALALPEDKTVEIVVEHFEIDGYAVLDFTISPQE